MSIKLNYEIAENPLESIEATCICGGNDKLKVIVFERYITPLLSFRKNDPRSSDPNAYTSVLMTLTDADRFADSIKTLVKQERARLGRDKPLGAK